MIILRRQYICYILNKLRSIIIVDELQKFRDFLADDGLLVRAIHVMPLDAVLEKTIEIRRRRQIFWII